MGMWEQAVELLRNAIFVGAQVFRWRHPAGVGVRPDGAHAVDTAHGARGGEPPGDHAPHSTGARCDPTTVGCRCPTSGGRNPARVRAGGGLALVQHRMRAAAGPGARAVRVVLGRARGVGDGRALLLDSVHRSARRLAGAWGSGADRRRGGGEPERDRGAATGPGDTSGCYLARGADPDAVRRRPLLGRVERRQPRPGPLATPGTTRTAA